MIFLNKTFVLATGSIGGSWRSKQREIHNWAWPRLHGVLYWGWRRHFDEVLSRCLVKKLRAAQIVWLVSFWYIIWYSLRLRSNSMFYGRTRIRERKYKGRTIIHIFVNGSSNLLIVIQHDCTILNEYKPPFGNLDAIVAFLFACLQSCV